MLLGEVYCWLQYISKIHFTQIYLKDCIQLDGSGSGITYIDVGGVCELKTEVVRLDQIQMIQHFLIQLGAESLFLHKK